MRAEGHYGFAALVLSPLAYAATLTGMNPRDATTMLFLAISLSTLPDIDLRLRVKHRGPTHSAIFACIIGLGMGALLSYSGLPFYLGLSATILASLTHLAADALTYRPFNPLYPLADLRVALRLVRADDPVVNYGFMKLGTINLAAFLIASNPGARRALEESLRIGASPARILGLMIGVVFAALILVLIASGYSRRRRRRRR